MHYISLWCNPYITLTNERAAWEPNVTLHVSSMPKHIVPWLCKYLPVTEDRCCHPVPSCMGISAQLAPHLYLKGVWVFLQIKLNRRITNRAAMSDTVIDFCWLSMNGNLYYTAIKLYFHKHLEPCSVMCFLLGVDSTTRWRYEITLTLLVSALSPPCYFALSLNSFASWFLVFFLYV